MTHVFYLHYTSDGGRDYIYSSHCLFQVDLDYATGGERDHYGSCVLELTCTNLISAEAIKTVTSNKYQPFGDWMAKVTCPVGHFLVAFRMRVEAYLGAEVWEEDVGVTDFVFRCRGPGLSPPPGTTIYTDIVGVGLDMGTWMSWSAECPLGSAICAVHVLMEDCSRTDDCAAINDVRCVCCDF